MIKVENIETFNFEGAIRGCRNPMNSHDKSDSYWTLKEDMSPINPNDEPFFEIGENDLDLMRRLYKAGPEHRKYLRQIFVSMDITCHHTFWGEFDTYKIGVTRNSCSKMHRIHVKPFETDDFSHEGIDEVGGRTKNTFELILYELERLRKLFNETHEKKYWRALIELLPMSYNLRATITMNYENVVNIIHQRTGHKLDEWNNFVEILKELPYIKEIIGETSDKDKQIPGQMTIDNGIYGTLQYDCRIPTCSYINDTEFLASQVRKVEEQV